MHLLIVLILALGASLYLTMLARQHPNGAPYKYLLYGIDLWLALVLLWFLLTAVFDLS